MSLVTDIVMIIPAFRYDAHERFEQLVATHLPSYGKPEPKEEDFKSTGQRVYHLGANYCPVELWEALLAGPWPAGTVLLLQREEIEDEPIITVFGNAQVAHRDK